MGGLAGRREIGKGGGDLLEKFAGKVESIVGNARSAKFYQEARYLGRRVPKLWAAGLNELPLRNLGVNRTLVLVIGSRHVSGESNTAAVDVNSNPTDLIERVDALTGGASSVYGADGVPHLADHLATRQIVLTNDLGQIGRWSHRRSNAPTRAASRLIRGLALLYGRGGLVLAALLCRLSYGELLAYVA